MSQPGGTTTSPTCSKPTCNPLACSSTCPTGFLCTADVITNICQCPSASCVKIGFDIGAGNGDDDSDSDSAPSLIGPIIGAIAGLAAIACIAFFVIRKRRQKKRRSSVLMLGQDDSNDSFSKRWNPSSGSEFAGHKDVIRIAYIPSMIGDSPAGRPGSSALPAPQPQFASLRNGDRNKHDSVGSVGSHMSAVLDEAVVMAVTTKATPQVMNFNAIKASQSDLIQRSNTLHSTNSIKRSTSQRRIADAKKDTTNTTKAGVQRTPSPLAGGARSGSTHVLSDSDENDSDPESSNGTSVTQTAHMRRRSAEKQNLMDSNNNPFMSPSELLASGSALPSPSGTSVTRHNEDTLVSRKGSTSPYRTSNPFMSQSESATLIPGLSPDTHAASSNRFSTVSSGSHPSPALSASSTFASIPIRLGGDIIDDSNDPLSPFADLAGGSNLRPWMSSGTPALRDSTFSTMSDARSSTRGDGEEIMIFWGGQHNRDSKASNI